MAHTGRNDPCPCGSGKKFKKCCINKIEVKSNNESQSSINDYDDYKRDIIIIDEIPDYGVPLVNEQFLNDNPFAELSAQSMLSIDLINNELGEIAAKILSPLISRCFGLKSKIEKARTLDELIEILKNKPDPLLNSLLKSKILEYGKDALDRLFIELLNPPNEIFVEQSIKIIYESKIDCIKQTHHLIRNCQKDSYYISEICVLLGFIDRSEETKKILWDYYHFFKEYYPNENFKEGPLIGLGEIYYQENKELKDKELEKKRFERRELKKKILERKELEKEEFSLF
jgi:hypothetical protein